MAEVLVESGDRVASGQVLVRLERAVLDSQARQAEQAAKRARVELAQATEQHRRAQRLMPAGAVSRQDYEAARATMLVSQAALRQAEAAWEEERARQAHTEIRAPFAGTITQRSIQVGAMVGVQSSLFRLASDQPPEFLAQIPQRWLQDLAVGMPAQVSTRDAGETLTGAVRLIGTSVDLATGYGQSRITVSPPPPVSLHLGSVGTAHIALTPRDVLAVDARALRFDTTTYVFVVQAGRAKRTPVQVGQREDGWVEVLAGVDANTPVVVAGASLLRDGDPVQPQEAGTEASTAEVRHAAFTRRLSSVWPLGWKSLMAPLPVGART
ncbi:Nickel and cobalt resistance protein CnrB [compost metagenome]